MKLNVELLEMSRQVTRMGATMSSWRSSDAALSPFAKLIQELEKGIEFTDVSLVNARHGGLLTYEGEQILLYIKATRQDRETLLYDPKNARKFHIAECKAIEDMKKQGRFERYVATNNTSGEFLVEATDPYTKEVEELTSRLHVCKFCLSKLNWHDYKDQSSSGKNSIRDDFSIEDFFGEFSTFFRSKPKYTDSTAPKDGYAANWSKISTMVREKKRWQCDGCKVDLSEHRSLLHCHHKSGDITDNSFKNLTALCVLCHSEQPGHSWMKPNPKYRLLVEKLRMHENISTDDPH